MIMTWRVVLNIKGEKAYYTNIWVKRFHVLLIKSICYWMKLLHKAEGDNFWIFQSHLKAFLTFLQAWQLFQLFLSSNFSFDLNISNTSLLSELFIDYLWIKPKKCPVGKFSNSFGELMFYCCSRSSTRNIDGFIHY